MVAQFDKDQEYVDKLNERRRRDLAVERQQELQRSFLLEQMDELASDFAGFERSVCGSITIADVAGSELVIERGPPNLGVLTAEQYAVIFYSCLESEIFPKLRALDFDPDAAWKARGRAPA